MSHSLSMPALDAHNALRRRARRWSPLTLLALLLTLLVPPAQAAIRAESTHES